MSRRPVAVLIADLLMAVMDSPAAWAAAAGDPRLGLAWRDAVTARMRTVGRYVPYERLVDEEAARAGLEPAAALGRLREAWEDMAPRPDADALRGLGVPLGLLTNCSQQLADLAARRSGLPTAFVLSAERIGWYKPHPRAYAAAIAAAGHSAGAIGYLAGTPYDAVGAASAGLNVVLVRRRPELGDPAGVPVAADLAEAVARLGR